MIAETSNTSHAIAFTLLSFTPSSSLPSNHIVVNQMKLCDQKLFSLLADLLTLEDTPPPLTTTAAYLAGCLMCSNSEYLEYIVQLLYSEGP